MNEQHFQQLNEDQINQIFDYTHRLNISYKDVQYEMVDHIASGVEDLMDENPSMTFNRAMYENAGQYAHSFFTDIISNKTKALQKFWLKNFSLFLLKFFTIPRIILTVILFLGFKFVFDNFQYDQIKDFILVLYMLIIVFLLVFRKKRLTEKFTSQYLILESYRKAVNVMLVTFLLVPAWIMSQTFREEYMTPIMNNIHAVFFTSIILILYSSKIVFPQFLKNELSKKYNHLEIKLA